MSYEGYRPFSTVRNPRQLVAVTGQGVRLRVRRHQLEITDGFPLEASQETRRLSRATHKIERLVCLAGSGWLSLSVLDWLRENDIPFLGLGQDGSLRWLTLVGPGGAWQAKLRRAQALAPWSPIGLQIASWLIAEKVRREASLLHAYAPRMASFGATSAAIAAQTLLQAIPQVEQAKSIQQIRRMESELAEVSWSGWHGLAVRVRPPSFATVIPPHIVRFATRHSPLSGRSQHAVNVQNSLINLAHALVVAECAIGAHAQGLDSHLPLIHADRDARASFLLDLAEPIYPLSERLVLDLLLSHEFRRGEFHVLRSGVVRLDQDFVTELLPRWIPLIRQSVAPVVEKVASWLRRGKITPQDHPAQKAGQQTHDGGSSVPRGVCPECGSAVRPGRRFCSQACYAVWWKAHMQCQISRQGTETLARLRAEGYDPAHAPEVTQQRVASYVATRRRQNLATPPNSERETANRVLQKAIREAKQGLNVRDLAQALHLSHHTTHALAYAEDYKAGQRVAGLIAENCAELLRAGSAPMPPKILKRLHRAARAIARHPAQIRIDDRGRFMKDWNKGT